MVVERYVDRDLWIVSRVQAGPGEMLTLAHIGSTPPRMLATRVTECGPVVVEGILRHRLRLTVLGGQRDPNEPAVLAVLMKVLPVRVMEISRVGCSFQTPSLLQEGTTGTLHLNVDGELCSVRIVVARGFSIVGAGGTLHCAAAEFVWSHRQSDDLLQATVTKMQQSDSAGASGTDSNGNGHRDAEIARFSVSE